MRRTAGRRWPPGSATLPDAHAASWRAAGVSHRPSLTRGGHRAEVALPGEHLAEGVADVDDVDVGGVDLGRLERVVDDLGGQVGEVVAFAGEVAREVALIAAEDPDVRQCPWSDGTTTKRVTRADSAAQAAPSAPV